MSNLLGFDVAALTRVLVLTLLLGGAGAWVTGKAIAETWKPYWQLVWYMLLLAAAVGFFHYALFQRPLLEPIGYAADAIYLLMMAAIGHRYARQKQMRDQYGWLRHAN